MPTEWKTMSQSSQKTTEAWWPRPFTEEHNYKRCSFEVSIHVYDKSSFGPLVEGLSRLCRILRVMARRNLETSIGASSNPATDRVVRITVTGSLFGTTESCVDLIDMITLFTAKYNEAYVIDYSTTIR